MKPLGVKLLAVEDAAGAVFDPDGIDPDELDEYCVERGCISVYPNAQLIDRQTFMGTKADIFIPAALENQINDDTAPLLNVKLVAEGANEPTDIEGDRILQEKGISVLPDILCNAGGVIVSFFEWLQNKRSEYWDLDDVDNKLYKIMMRSYERVKEAAVKHDTDWRTAAYIVALSRIEKV